MRFTNSELEMIYQYAAPTKARFLAGHENSIRRRLAEAKAQQPVMQGHDLTGMERFLPETRQKSHAAVVAGKLYPDRKPEKER